MPDSYTALLSGSNWGGIEVTGKPTIVTFSFPAVAPAYNTAIGDGNLTPAVLATFQAFTTGEQALARTALAEWGDNSGLVFIEVAPGQGDINFQKLNFTGTGYAGVGGIAYRPFGNWQNTSYPYFTSDLDSAGDVFMNSAATFVYGTLLHEIGHALGLKHPTEQWTQFASYPPIVHDTWAVDDPALTIMSQLGGGTGHLTAFDIAAIQSIYGTQAQDGTQVSSYAWNAATQTLTQTGFAGADAIRGSSVRDVINGDDGDDKLFGLNGNDTLRGGAGNDLLDGGPGADSLEGGAGNDTYFVDGSSDKIKESANDGWDSVISTASSYTLPANVEALQFWLSVKVTGKGNALDNTIFGTNGGSTLSGLGGNDYLVGGSGKDKIDGGTGADAMYGEEGDDSYVVDNPFDYVYDSGTTANDLVTASVSWTLITNLEKLTLSGLAAIDGTGNELANTLTGNAAANSLYGLGGKDTLSGGAGNDVLSGGAQADLLTGGTGNDRFVFDVLGTSGDKDTVKDFAEGDLFVFARSAFGALAGQPAGPLGAAFFIAGAAALTTDQHIVYNAATGILGYDADGSGAGAMVQVAVLSNRPLLDAGDFLLA